MGDRQCSRCKSVHVITDARVLDQGQYSDGRLNVAIFKDPDALIMKGTVREPVEAVVCGECGFVELFVEDPRVLYARYLQANPELKKKRLGLNDRCLKCGAPTTDAELCPKCAWTYPSPPSSGGKRTV